jgi:toxin ParE1/3/4
MDFKIVWSDAAIADLQEICAYIAQDNPQAALDLGRGILDHVRVLSSFPFIGPTYPRGVKGTLREIVFRSYRIFYDVSEKSTRVEILHIWHPSRDEPAFPAQ